jgi:hypothetical protein
MKRPHRHWLGLSLLAAALAALAAGGRADERPRAEEGYTSLFNGKDLTGWRYGPKREPMAGRAETPDGRFKVRDGVLVAEPKDNQGRGGIRDLYTVADFNKNFRLKLEFRAAPRADSGVYFRGTQLQVRDYPTVGPYKKLKNFKDGGWNELDVTVRNGVLLTVLNGQTLTDRDALELTVRDGKPQAKLNGKAVEVKNLSVQVTAVAECRCNGEVIEKAFKVPERGGIGLQAESGKFEFRNVRVKGLD